MAKITVYLSKAEHALLHKLVSTHPKQNKSSEALTAKLVAAGEPVAA